MRKPGIGEEPGYKQKKKAAEEHRDRTQQHTENISAITAVTIAIDSATGEQRAARNQADRQEDGKRNREWTTISVIGTTAVVALLTLLVTHCDTTRLISEAKRSSNQQHRDTLAAIETAKTANKTAIDSAASQIAEMTRQSASMQGQLDVMRADQRPWLVVDKENPPTPLNVDPRNFMMNGWFATLTLRNIGKSPAYEPFIITKTTALPPPAPYADTGEELREWCRALHPQGRIGDVVFPNDTIPGGGSGIPMMADDIKRTLGPDGTVMPVTVLICIMYKFSVDGEFHHTGAAFDFSQIDRSGPEIKYRGFTPNSGVVGLADIHMVKSFLGRGFAD